jgi:hypothetical protein
VRPERDKKAWLEAARGKAAGSRGPAAGRNAKGIGPNKASGHKGGISRQGSKRG